MGRHGGQSRVPVHASSKQHFHCECVYEFVFERDKTKSRDKLVHCRDSGLFPRLHCSTAWNTDTGRREGERERESDIERRRSKYECVPEGGNGLFPML